MSDRVELAAIVLAREPSADGCAVAEDQADLKVGQQSLDQEFIVSQNALLFVNTMFGWPMVPSADLPGGGPAYPLSALGVRLRVRPAQSLTGLLAVTNGNPAPDNLDDPQVQNPSGTSFPLNGGAVVIGELRYNYPAVGALVTSSQEHLHQGTYKVGFWYNSESFDDLQFDNAELSLANPQSTTRRCLPAGQPGLLTGASAMRPAPGSALDGESDCDLFAFLANRQSRYGVETMTRDLPAKPLKAAAVLFATLAALALPSGQPARAAEAPGLLGTIHRHVTAASTVTDNGDLNPYAVVVAPATIGKIQKGDVLVDNFNNVSNLQGTGTTIISYRPATKTTALFAKLPQHVSRCPGGVGLSTAMAVLKSGWVIVGSTPSTDGTTRTKGNGCLLVLDANGRLAAVWAGPAINDPWGNMAVADRGATATLFISMAGFGVPGPQVVDASGAPVVVNKATVLRLDLAIAPGQQPKITSQTVVANGFGQRADKEVFLIGPTGLALGPDGTLYVSDALGNRIVAIPDAMSRTSSAGAGRVVTKDDLLKRPLTLVMTAAVHLLACNGLNGQVVEIDPASGKQLCAQWIDANQAQSPPGSGDLFGLAMAPDGNGFYYVEDDMNTLVEATR